MAEPKSESVKREQRVQERAEGGRSGSVGLVRLTQAVGDCATELAAGTVRAAGGLITDLVGSCVSPCDQITRRGRFVEDADVEAGRDRGFTGAFTRAVDGATDAVVRAQERFQEVLGEDEEPPKKST